MNSSKNKLNNSKNKLNSKNSCLFKPMPNAILKIQKKYKESDMYIYTSR